MKKHEKILKALEADLADVRRWEAQATEYSEVMRLRPFVHAAEIALACARSAIND